jgi:hypothetical protein
MMCVLAVYSIPGTSGFQPLNKAPKPKLVRNKLGGPISDRLCGDTRFLCSPEGFERPESFLLDVSKPLLQGFLEG